MEIVECKYLLGSVSLPQQQRVLFLWGVLYFLKRVPRDSRSLGIASTGRDTICKLTGKASVLCKMFILKLHVPFLALLKIWETTPHRDNSFYRGMARMKSLMDTMLPLQYHQVHPYVPMAAQWASSLVPNTVS
ncbi:hypothetical protein Goari_015791 [Gossypium aridum]|uniref:Uncharacterized protein n=1 Tax=Gossypium aridum TaxID=34290 RepID=A0A7J8WGM4_GOSAI|nr:hypothetical protein [Gossypium aridum]